MKPVRLTVQAFGPYPDRQQVDFRDAVEAGLFGIYGRTGSGKSTLFSAMTFALFGGSANHKQEAVSLRSDHAAADLLTEVEFVFKVGERQYVVVRRPEQMRPSRRGGGEARNAHEAYLFDATGLEVEDITEDRRGKVIAEKKVGLVDDAIVERLGYGEEQFKQIVLLPQGRFETFLTAKSTDRSALLQDLFDVTLFQSLAESLKEQADAAERQVQREREVYTQRLMVEGFADDAALGAGLQEAEECRVLRAQQLTDAREQARIAGAAVRAAENVEERFRAAASAAQKRDTLLARAGEMDDLARQVERMQQARLLTDAEDAVRTAEAERQGAEKAVQRAEAENAAATETERRATERRATELAREPEDAALQRAIADLERHQQTVTQAAAALRELDTARSTEVRARDAVDAADRERGRLKITLDQKRDALKRAEETEKQRQMLNSQCLMLQQGLKQATEFFTMEQSVRIAADEVQTCQDARDQAAETLQQALMALKQAEQAVTRSQALHLASQLVAGNPCPVCGGRDHPAPAQGHAEAEDPVAARGDAETRWRDADDIARQAEQQLTGARRILQERTQRFEELIAPEQTPEALRASLSEVEAAREALAPESDSSGLEREIADLTTRLVNAEAECERVNEAREAASVAVATRQERCRSLLETVPERLQDLSALEEELTGHQAQLRELRVTRQQAEEAWQQATTAALNRVKELEAARERLDDRQRRCKAVSETFDRHLQQAGLTPETYCSLKAGLSQLDQKRAIVEAFRRDLAGAQLLAQQAQAAVQDVPRPDIAPLREQLAGAEAAVQTAQDKDAEARQRQKTLHSLQLRLADARQALEEVEAVSAPLRGLAAAVNGRNARNLSLKIYALAAMFDVVLQAANLRLAPMTGHRYQLVRDGGGGGRGQRGLELLVFDAHTGKDRPTATLSGGETFIAALALALGLADVVESTNGRVQLDTVFIDEGFGSLDTEQGAGTLDQVLQVLNGLVSQNRAVGLISHVPLVQEAIPNGFYVHKRAGGSRIEARDRNSA